MATSSSSVVWLYFIVECSIGAAISAFVALLHILRSIILCLPKAVSPSTPAISHFTGHVVLVTVDDDASSRLGTCISSEFARNGWTVIRVIHTSNDHIYRDYDKGCKNADYADNNILTRIDDSYLIESTAGGAAVQHEPDQNQIPESTPALFRYYYCDVYDRHALRKLAQKVENDIGNSIDVLITCYKMSDKNDDFFETVDNTLITHYWTVLAFLRLLLQNGRGCVVGVTPTSSRKDAFNRSRAAIAGLMESLNEEFSSRISNNNTSLSFITVAPKADPRLLKRSEEQVARDIVEAVKRDRSSI